MLCISHHHLSNETSYNSIYANIELNDNMVMKYIEMVQGSLFEQIRLSICRGPYN